MARQSRQGFIRRYEQVERELRTERVRRRGHTADPTWIVGGITLDTSIVLPRKAVGLDIDGETPEWKRLIAFNGLLDAGTAMIGWELNATTIATVNVSTTAVDDTYLDTPIDLAHADQLRPVITSASSDAFGLSATAYIVSAVR